MLLPCQLLSSCLRLHVCGFFLCAFGALLFAVIFFISLQLLFLPVALPIHPRAVPSLSLETRLACKVVFIWFGQVCSFNSLAAVSTSSSVLSLSAVCVFESRPCLGVLISSIGKMVIDMAGLTLATLLSVFCVTCLVLLFPLLQQTGTYCDFFATFFSLALKSLSQ